MVLVDAVGVGGVSSCLLLSEFENLPESCIRGDMMQGVRTDVLYRKAEADDTMWRVDIIGLAWPIARVIQID